MEHALSGQNRERLAQCILDYHCRFALENDTHVIRAFVNQVQEKMAGLGLTDAIERIRIGEAVEEALLNAMFHGNLEIDSRELEEARSELDDRLIQSLIDERCCDPRIRDRWILVVVHLTCGEARFVIRDEGRGFRQFISTTKDSSGDFESGRHRGLTLIRSMMDEATFNDNGNELTLRRTWRRVQKRLRRRSESP
jgi:anti-sigma regulatory factor (Ser/Thr protein kinase)